MNDNDDSVFLIGTIIISFICFMAHPIVGAIALFLGLLLYGIGKGLFDE